MSSRDLSHSDFAGLELEAERRNRFAELQFADLEHPCSPVESAAMTVGVFLLALSPVLIVAAFKIFG